MRAWLIIALVGATLIVFIIRLERAESRAASAEKQAAELRGEVDDLRAVVIELTARIRKLERE
jgi:ubiquinone biosynthesis protein UbiJ